MEKAEEEGRCRSSGESQGGGGDGGVGEREFEGEIELGVGMEEENERDGDSGGEGRTGFQKAREAGCGRCRGESEGGRVCERMRESESMTKAKDT